MNVVEYTGEIEALRPVAEVWKRECNASSFSMAIDDEYTLGTLEGLQYSDCSCVMVLQSKAGRILGFMGLIVFQSPLSGELELHEQMWFILSEHRSMMVTHMFIDAAEMWGKARGACNFLLTSSHLANIDAARVGRLYHRMGFEPFETTYIREIR